MSMIEFDNYMPSTWVENGLLKRISKAKPREEAARYSRKGKWVTGSSVLMFTCATMSLATLPDLPNKVAAPSSLSAEYRLQSSRAEDHFVPDHYWDRLGEAIKSVGYLPAQDISNDPSILV